MTDITVLIPTSPIPTHPDTAIVCETINSVRESLDSEILVAFDGVRPEQEHMADTYAEYQRRLLWLMGVWGEVWPVRSEGWLHQAALTRLALEHVDTPLVLFVEHDTPLRGQIPWELMIPLVRNGDMDVIRLSHEAQILAEHRHLMVDLEPGEIGRVPLIRTRQWSQRPHLARTEWYRQMLDRWFTADGRSFIEDRMYGVVLETGSWVDWKLALYAPPGNMTRSMHTDGRAGGPKYAESQSW